MDIFFDPVRRDCELLSVHVEAFVTLPERRGCLGGSLRTCNAALLPRGPVEHLVHCIEEHPRFSTVANPTLSDPQDCCSLNLVQESYCPAAVL